MKIKTSELNDAALDWAVRVCLNRNECFDLGLLPESNIVPAFRPSMRWAQGGPLIEREGIDLLKNGGVWTALKTMTIDHPHLRVSGPTPLIAAMRCFVASRLGDEVEVPEELKE